jgi:hypothetical protein
MTERTAQLVERVCSLGEVCDVDWSTWFDRVTIVIHSHVMPDEGGRQPLHEIICQGVLEWCFSDRTPDGSEGSPPVTRPELSRERRRPDKPRCWSVGDVSCTAENGRVVLDLNPDSPARRTLPKPSLKVVCKDIQVVKLSWSIVDVMWGMRDVPLGTRLLRPSLRDTARMIAKARASKEADGGPAQPG